MFYSIPRHVWLFIIQSQFKLPPESLQEEFTAPRMLKISCNNKVRKSFCVLTQSPVVQQSRTTMGDKSVETLGSKIRFWSALVTFSSLSPNNVDFSISSTAQTTAP